MSTVPRKDSMRHIGELLPDADLISGGDLVARYRLLMGIAANGGGQEKTKVRRADNTSEALGLIGTREALEEELKISDDKGVRDALIQVRKDFDACTRDLGDLPHITDGPPQT